MKVTGTLDGKFTRYQFVGGDQSEDQDPVFELEDGATLKNVIIGNKAGDGVHCRGTCTLSGVWWEDVGEDAATLMSSAPASAVMTIDGGGAREAEDKVFQHNGDGTLIVRNFQVENFGKLVRTCGNCGDSFQRDVIVDNVVAIGGEDGLVGINVNFGDTATLTRVIIVGDTGFPICLWYKGTSSGSEPEKLGDGPSENCVYKASDITYTDTVPATGELDFVEEEVDPSANLPPSLPAPDESIFPLEPLSGSAAQRCENVMSSDDVEQSRRCSAFIKQYGQPIALACKDGTQCVRKNGFFGACVASGDKELLRDQGWEGTVMECGQSMARGCEDLICGGKVYKPEAMARMEKKIKSAMR